VDRWIIFIGMAVLATALVLVALQYRRHESDLPICASAQSHCLERPALEL
jgi:hypothetical protein